MATKRENFFADLSKVTINSFIMFCLATKNVSFEYDRKESTDYESKSLAQAGRHRSNFEGVPCGGDAN
jgi:hypothetical protein